MRIVGRSSDAGDRDVFEVVTVGIADHFKNFVHEILFLRRRVRRFVEVDDVFSVKEIRGLHAVDRSDGKSRFVGGRRTDRTRIGVGSKPVVTVFRGSHRGVVAVGRRRDKGDARLADALVDLFHVFFVFFSREPAGSTEGHVDHVYPENDAVFHGCQDPRRFRAVLTVGENLHDGELRIGSDARDRIVFSGDDARYVRAVFGVDGKNVRILIGIIVSIRHFFVQINVLSGKTGRKPGSRRFTDFFRNGRKGETLVVRSESIHAERGVRIVETGIEHRHDDPVALIFESGAVENTRVVHVDVVRNDVGDRSFVHVADHDGSVPFEKATHFFEISRFHGNFETAHDHVIIFSERIGNARLFQFSDQFRAFRRFCRRYGLRLFRQGILGYGKALVALFVSVHHGIGAHRYDNGDLLIIRNGVRKLIGDVSVEIRTEIVVDIRVYLRYGVDIVRLRRRVGFYGRAVIACQKAHAKTYRR